MRIAARAPNHLGDGVVAIPALRALAAAGHLTIHAPRWGRVLYRDLDAVVLPTGSMARHDVAVLFPPSLRAALEARRCRRRVGTPTDGRRWLLTDVVSNTPVTATRYRALAGALGVDVDGLPRLESRPTDRPATVPAGHVGLAPLSAAGSVRQWPGFSELAQRLTRDVVWYGGPGEEDAITAIATRAGRGQMLVGQPLGDLVATWLSGCAVLVTNDSGLGHLARAVGVPVVSVFGSTVPEWTGPSGALAVEGPALPCRPCYGRTCRVGGHPCFEVAASRVLETILRVLRG